MDITLQRILSLIPRNDNGKFKHGAKKDFAVSIGYQDGAIVSMWENGSSDSYRGKLFEISQKYGVSVEWLKGETDIKKAAPHSVERSAEDIEFFNLYQSAPEDIRAAVLTILRNGAGK